MWRKYGDEFKQQAVKKVIDGQSVVSVAQELGINESLIHTAVSNALCLRKATGGFSGAELSRETELKKRIRELEMENAHPKKGSPYLRARKLERYRFIESQKHLYPIILLCRVMKANRSAYYAYAKHLTYREIALRVAVAARVKECFDFNRRRYGSRRIAVSLKLNRSTMQKAMRRESLRAIQPKSFKPNTTDSKHGLPVCANQLQNGANAPAGKGEVFAS